MEFSKYESKEKITIKNYILPFLLSLFLLYCIRRNYNEDKLYHMLQWASKHGNLEVIKYLYKRGIDINTRHNNALLRASENGHLEVVKYLVEKGADIRSYDSAAIRASWRGHKEVVKYLVEKGAESNCAAVRINIF
jgi:ankyrin repeat protein